MNRVNDIIIVVQPLSHVRLCDHIDCSVLGFPVLLCLLEFPQIMPIESVIPSNHLILCHPLLLLPSIFPSIRVFHKLVNPKEKSTLNSHWKNRC